MKYKKIIVFLLIVASFILQSCEKVFETSGVSSSSEISTGFEYNNEEFDDYLDELFIAFLQGSPLDINFLLRYPEKYGLENEEVSPTSLSKDGHDEYMNFLTEVMAEISEFDDEELSSQQRLDKRIILDAFSRELLSKGFYYYERPLSSTLGYQAQLPFILAEYRFDDNMDVYNYLKVIESLPSSFESLINYEKEKIVYGLGLSDELIDKIILQCENLLDQELNFLIPVFNEKIGYVLDLRKSKETYINEHIELINNKFVPAYEYLIDELNKLKGNSTIYGGLSHYENGQAYYISLLKQDLGINFNSIDEIKDEIEQRIDKTIKDLELLIMFKPELYYEFQSYDFSKGMDEDELLDYLVDKIKNDFPSLVTANLEYEFKNVHPSLQETSSPAMYLISPIDSNAKEVIYINPSEVMIGETYLYNIIAHEAVPGHLYQHVYFKNSKAHPIRHLLSYSGYSEGWAKYVENFVIKYTSSSAGLTKVYQYNNLIYHLVITRCDIGVNYDSWDKTQLTTYLKKYFSINEDGIDDLYFQLVENPGNYAKYYYTYYQFIKLKDYMEKEIGTSFFKDYDFHKIVLDTGPCPFDILKEEIDKNISKFK
ncbi:TPA: DUF885 domain-containing protein [bacterium]|nr:DUF885 domain-containing protein [bacterium]